MARTKKTTTQTVSKERLAELIQLELEYNAKKLRVNMEFRRQVNMILKKSGSKLYLQPYGDDECSSRVMLDRDGDKFLSDVYDNGHAYVHVSDEFRKLCERRAKEVGSELNYNNDGSIMYLHVPFAL